MSRSATDLERDILDMRRRCLAPARGVWADIRRLIDESDRPGHLRCAGRYLSDAQLALEAGCESDDIAPHLDALVAAGLIVRGPDGIHSPILSRIAAVRGSGAQRVRRHRALHNTACNTPCNADVTPIVTGGVPSSPSPVSSPPITPSTSSPSPTPSPGFDGGSNATGQLELIPGSNGRRPPSGPTVEEIYAAYPRKIAKGDALAAIAKAIKKLEKRGSPPDAFQSWPAWLMAAVVEYAQKRCTIYTAFSDEESATPYPATWMNQERFDDDRAQWSVPTKIENQKGKPDVRRTTPPTNPPARRGEFEQPQRPAPRRILPGPTPGIDRRAS